MSSTINICHLIASNFFGGPERQIFEHIKLLNNRGNYQGVVCSYLEGDENAPLLEQCSKAGIPFFSIKARSAYDFNQISELKHILDKNKINLLCAHGYRSTIIGLFARHRLNIPVIGFSRGWTKDNIKIRLYNWVDRVSLAFVDHIVAVSYGQKQRLLQFNFGYPSISVAQNCINLEPYDSKYSSDDIKIEFGIPDGCIVIGSVGRLSPEKGHRYLLEAFAAVLKKTDNAVLVVIGDGVSEHSLKKQSQSLNIEDKVFFLGFRHDVHRILTIFDLFVLPSEQEGLPNALLEAFAAQIPVVATAVGGVPEVLDDGVSGYMVPPCRSDMLSGAILKCLELPKSMLVRMGKSGFKRVESDFTFQKQTIALEAIYKEVITSFQNSKTP